MTRVDWEELTDEEKKELLEIHGESAQRDWENAVQRSGEEALRLLPEDGVPSALDWMFEEDLN